jgi:hypothetical protein
MWIASLAWRVIETHISPSVIFLFEIERLRIIGTSRVRTVLTAASRVGIRHISRVGRQEVGHVLATRLPVRDTKRSELRLFSIDLDVPDDGTQKTTEQIGEWVKVVEPVLPEGLHRLVRHDDAAERDHAGTDQNRVHDGCKVLVGSIRRDCLADGSIQELVN